MKWIYKMERKFGKFAIPNLMKYVIGLKILGAFLGLLNPNLYVLFFSFDGDAIMHGQVWRLLTFVLYPSIGASNVMMDVLFLAIMAFLYYSIGNTLERVWGTFRFNLYFFTGVLFTILVSLAYYFVTGDNISGVYYVSFDYIYQAMFLTFAFLFPDTQFLVYFVIPIKAKWLGIIYAAISVYGAGVNLREGQYLPVFLFLAAFANFFIFYLLTRNANASMSFASRAKHAKRKVQYRNTAEQNSTSSPRHRCTICGRTELDAPNLDFRYCSKCEGNYEYCSEHLFTHEHVHKH